MPPDLKEWDVSAFDAEIPDRLDATLMTYRQLIFGKQNAFTQRGRRVAGGVMATWVRSARPYAASGDGFRFDGNHSEVPKTATHTRYFDYCP